MHKTNLMLHCGARREQLTAVATPTRTATWVPIPHDRLLSGVQSCLERAGLAIATEAHGVTSDGDRYFGLLQIGNSQDAADFGLVVGLRNSHDRMFPAGLVVGASVFVCDNLSFSGEIRLARKHTVHVERDLPQFIERAVGQLGDLRRTQESRFIAYKQRELTDTAAHDLVIQALDARVMPVTRVPNVLAEWRQPRHPEFREGRTAWRLFNAFTESLKGRLDALPARTQALHGLLDAACGLAVNRN
jgi:hypothetical protein